jgi:hypothetical protein
LTILSSLGIQRTTDRRKVTLFSSNGLSCAVKTIPGIFEPVKFIPWAVALGLSLNPLGQAPFLGNILLCLAVIAVLWLT